MAWAAPSAAPASSSLPVADHPSLLEPSSAADTYFTYADVAESGHSERCWRSHPELLSRAVRCQVLSPGSIQGTVVCYLPDHEMVVTRQLNSMVTELYACPRLPPEWDFPQRIRELFGRRRLGTIVEIRQTRGRYQDQVRIRFDADLFPAREPPAELVARFTVGRFVSSEDNRTRTAPTLDPTSAFSMRGVVVTLLGCQLSSFSYACPDLQFPRDDVRITPRLVGRRVAVYIGGQTEASSWGLLTAACYPGSLSEPHALLLDDRLREVLDER